MSYAADAARMYNQNRAEGDVACASPHRLISLMLAGVRRHCVAAAQALRENETARRGESTSSAIALLEELRVSLDADVGGALVTRLDSLYEYMVTRLLQSNLHGDPEGYAEVLELLNSVEESWNELPSRVAGKLEDDEPLARYFRAGE